MSNFYEEVYQYLIDENIEEEEATEVVNHLYEANIHEYGLLTENRGRAILSMLRSVGMMTGLLKNPAAQKTVKATTKKILQGTPRQGNLLTKTGKAQNFTGGRNPFTSTSPVPAASSPLPKPPTKPAVSPGQMQIPGTSARAQELRNVTRNPNTGLPGGSNTGLTMSGGRASQRSIPTLKAQPRRVAPKIDGPSAMSITRGDKVVYSIPKKDVLTPSQMKAQRTADKVRALKVSGGIGVVGGTAAIVDKMRKDSVANSVDPRRPDGSLPPYIPPRPPADPKPEPKPEPSKEEPVKRSSGELSTAAKSFDKAFAAARKAGQSEFSWRGKKYNTKYKGE